MVLNPADKAESLFFCIITTVGLNTFTPLHREVRRGSSGFDGATPKALRHQSFSLGEPAAGA